MNQTAKYLSLTACALAASLFLSGCGGAEGDDTVAPTAAITSAASGSTVTFTFTFSEALGTGTGDPLTVDEITVVGGTVGTFTVVDTTHATLTVTATASIVSVSVAANKFADVSHNFNTATATASQAYDSGTTGLVIADFDTVVPGVRAPDSGGTGTITTTTPTGGSGSALALLRSGGEPWALNVLDATVPFTATRKTLSARVYSPTAGIPMKIKLEAGSLNTGDIAANETVVVGWQTLTWTFTNADITKTYNVIVLLPNIGTVDAAPGKTYYFDDIKLLAAASGTDSTTGSGSTTAVEMGAGGAQTLTVATGDVKTGDGGNTMFVAGEGLFAVNYVGSAETQPPFNLAAWPGAKTANFGSITGVAGGSIGYYQDDVNLSNSNQKVAEEGWVAGTALSANGVPSFFRLFVLKAAVSNNAYMGLYANAPNNGFVNTSSFSKIKFKVWGPQPMYQRDNLNPVLEMTLTGPKVVGCATGSGGTEITQTFTANLKNGAGGSYTLPISGFTVKGLCGADTNANAVANVRANLARVVINVPGTSFNYTNLEGGNYATGVQLGPIGFTNN